MVKISNIIKSDADGQIVRESNANTLKHLQRYFATYKHLLNVSAIEKEAGIPVNSLVRFARGERPLNPAHITPVYNILLKLNICTFR